MNYLFVSLCISVFLVYFRKNNQLEINGHIWPRNIQDIVTLAINPSRLKFR